MKKQEFDDNFGWMAGRLGKITGSRVGDIVNKAGPTKETIIKVLSAREIPFKKTAKKEELEALLPADSLGEVQKLLPKKIGYYALIAERLGVPADEEIPMERGHRIEREAIDRFEKETGMKVDSSLVIWSRDDNESIAISPDGVVVDGESPDSEATEVKCLSSARHVQAYITREIPEEYRPQCLQYFAVNDVLKRLNFICYDPRFSMFEWQKGKLDFFVLHMDREEVIREVEDILEFQRNILNEVDREVNRITGF